MKTIGRNSVSVVEFQLRAIFVLVLLVNSHAFIAPALPSPLRWNALTPIPFNGSWEYTMSSWKVWDVVLDKEMGEIPGSYGPNQRTRSCPLQKKIYTNGIPTSVKGTKTKHAKVFTMYSPVAGTDERAMPSVQSFFCCFYTSEMCSLRIWMMPLCHPWAVRTVCKLRLPLLKILFSSISH